MSKNILVIYPHFPPSNLAGVHRPRLLVTHLPAFGWNPVVLTVEEKYYEEAPDWNLVKLLPENLRIEKTMAFRITKPRIIGDIGLRAFFQLYRKAKQIITKERIDFLYIPVPSFYVALLGRWLHEKTGIKYGIDYIDPWVHSFPGSKRILSRHWWSTRLARILEHIAVKKAVLITGVAERYYQPVLERNAGLKKQAVCGAMPYGGEIADHLAIKELGVKPYLFDKKPGKVQLVYAGAMLPKAYDPLEKVLECIAANPPLFDQTEIHFIGTGKTPDDENGFTIKALAQKYGLWGKVIFEYPRRIPYLDVLVHLENADGVFILGSTEPHYTPSKVHQALLSGKPVLAVLHQDSTAVAIFQNSGTGIVLAFEENDTGKIKDEFSITFESYLTLARNYDPSKSDLTALDEYSAKKATQKLATLLNEAIAVDSNIAKEPGHPHFNYPACVQRGVFSKGFRRFGFTTIIFPFRIFDC